jgi:hypothetical protein
MLQVIVTREVVRGVQHMACKHLLEYAKGKENVVKLPES